MTLVLNFVGGFLVGAGVTAILIKLAFWRMVDTGEIEIKYCGTKKTKGAEC